MHAYSNTEFQNLIPVITSNVSSNRIKIQRNSINSTIRNRLLLQVIHFRNAPFEAVTLQSSQRLPELLFYTKKSYKILQLQSYTCTLHYNPENSPSRIHSTCRRQRALRVLQSSFQKFYA